jgi:predicted transcriptional regulator
MKKKQKVKDTSLLAYAEVLENLGERQLEVYKALYDLKEANNTMISEKLNLSINNITPRINEMRGYGIIRQSKKDICPCTKKKQFSGKYLEDFNY